MLSFCHPTTKLGQCPKSLWSEPSNRTAVTGSNQSSHGWHWWVWCWCHSSNQKCTLQGTAIPFDLEKIHLLFICYFLAIHFISKERLNDFFSLPSATWNIHLSYIETTVSISNHMLYFCSLILYLWVSWQILHISMCIKTQTCTFLILKNRKCVFKSSMNTEPAATMKLFC